MDDWMDEWMDVLLDGLIVGAKDKMDRNTKLMERIDRWKPRTEAFAWLALPSMEIGSKLLWFWTKELSLSQNTINLELNQASVAA